MHAYYVTKWHTTYTQYKLDVEKKMAKWIFFKTVIVEIRARKLSGFTCMCK